VDSPQLKEDSAALSLPQAFRRAFKGRLTQAELADELGVTQGTISKWAKLTDDGPPLERLPQIEKSCDRPLGFILRAAGYVADAQTVEEVLRSDHALDEIYVEIVVDAYRAAVARSAMRARS
jgi:transcriptional regulator with XRE-family HTH domain